MHNLLQLFLNEAYRQNIIKFNQLIASQYDNKTRTRENLKVTFCINFEFPKIKLDIFLNLLEYQAKFHKEHSRYIDCNEILQVGKVYDIHNLSRIVSLGMDYWNSKMSQNKPRFKD